MRKTYSNKGIKTWNTHFHDLYQSSSHTADPTRANHKWGRECFVSLKWLFCEYVYKFYEEKNTFCFLKEEIPFLINKCEIFPFP